MFRLFLAKIAIKRQNDFIFDFLKFYIQEGGAGIDTFSIERAHDFEKIHSDSDEGKGDGEGEDINKKF